MKSVTFRKVTITMQKVGNGQYKVCAEYKGRDVYDISNDSVTYDYLDNPDYTTNTKRAYHDACKSVYGIIVRAYERNPYKFKKVSWKI